MALFLIERNFAEQLQLGPDEVQQVSDVNDDIGIKWLFSFLSADQKKTFCLYEADDSAALQEQAKTMGIPADQIVEVSRFDPSAVLAQT